MINMTKKDINEANNIIEYKEDDSINPYDLYCRIIDCPSPGLCICSLCRKQVCIRHRHRFMKLSNENIDICAACVHSPRNESIITFYINYDIDLELKNKKNCYNKLLYILSFQWIKYPARIRPL